MNVAMKSPHFVTIYGNFVTDSRGFVTIYPDFAARCRDVVTDFRSFPEAPGVLLPEGLENL